MNRWNRPTSVLAALTLVAAGAAFAADSSPDTAAAAADPLAGTRALIAEKKWAAAIDDLKRIGDSGSADWNNLMGYSHRKAKAPDYAAAQRYYDTALRINPKHRGALEYSGELFLVLGDLARAQQRLTALDKACPLPCDEHADLKNAIARYQANGNRYLPAP